MCQSLRSRDFRSRLPPEPVWLWSRATSSSCDDGTGSEGVGAPALFGGVGFASGQDDGVNLAAAKASAKTTATATAGVLRCAQDDGVKLATAMAGAMAMASATANTGVLRCAQDDGVKLATAKATATATTTATSGVPSLRSGINGRQAGNGRCVRIARTDADARAGTPGGAGPSVVASDAIRAGGS